MRLASTPTPPAAGESRAYAAIARIALREAGLVLAPEKAPMVFSRLEKRMRARRVPTLEAYCDLLEHGSAGDEIRELVSVLTTNVTSFFRERHHFDYLTTEVLPGLVARALAGGRVRFWSAGCSTGEEPVSLAIRLLDLCPDIGRHDVRILATDIDPRVIAIARAAEYERTAGLDAGELAHHFDRRTGEHGQPVYRANDRVRALITVRELNLVGPWPFQGPFDVIFCRNVVIYFGDETRRNLWTRFGTVCGEGGHLLIGHSERIEGAARLGLVAVHTTTFRKTPKTRI